VEHAATILKIKEVSDFPETLGSVYEIIRRQILQQGSIYKEFINWLSKYKGKAIPVTGHGGP
jgi:hypothetical protein